MMLTKPNWRDETGFLQLTKLRRTSTPPPPSKPMLVQCWPTLSQHWFNVSCLPGPLGSVSHYHGDDPWTGSDSYISRGADTHNNRCCQATKTGYYSPKSLSDDGRGRGGGCSGGGDKFIVFVWLFSSVDTYTAVKISQYYIFMILYFNYITHWLIET